MRDSAAAQAEQLSLQSAEAARLQEELVTVRADADAQRQVSRQQAGAAGEALEEHSARLRDAEEAAAARAREVTSARDDISALQEANAHLEAKVCALLLQVLAQCDRCRQCCEEKDRATRPLFVTRP